MKPLVLDTPYMQITKQEDVLALGCVAVKHLALNGDWLLLNQHQ
jgi:hypothetical protein